MPFMIKLHVGPRLRFCCCTSFLEMTSNFWSFKFYRLTWGATRRGLSVYLFQNRQCLPFERRLHFKTFWGRTAVHHKGLKKRKKKYSQKLQSDWWLFFFFLIFFFNMFVCYFGYFCIAVSGVLASLICFVGCQDHWYLLVLGANTIPATLPSMQLGLKLCPRSWNLRPLN